eukprot:6059168-Alexandrium_andersonii.AAC.1
MRERAEHRRCAHPGRTACNPCHRFDAGMVRQVGKLSRRSLPPPAESAGDSHQVDGGGREPRPPRGAHL